jgi:membrane-associated phospholipid phosphatase
LGLSIDQLIGMLYSHPRPIMIGLGHQYLPHPVDNSFPSDHATFMWSLGFALLPLCNRVYEQLIRLIHLPPALFPQH